MRIWLAGRAYPALDGAPHQRDAGTLAMTTAQGPREASKREPWGDVVRGLGIALVVIGHVLSVETDTASRDVSWAIFLFHMPLFFVLSGYFWHPMPLKIYMKRRSLSLGAPYVSFMIFIVFIDTIISLFSGKNSVLLEQKWHCRPNAGRIFRKRYVRYSVVSPVSVLHRAHLQRVWSSVRFALLDAHRIANRGLCCGLCTHRNFSDWASIPVGGSRCADGAGCFLVRDSLEAIRDEGEVTCGICRYYIRHLCIERGGWCEVSI